MAVADKSAVVSLREELSHESILQEARSCEDEEFLFFLSRREKESLFRVYRRICGAIASNLSVQYMKYHILK